MIDDVTTDDDTTRQQPPTSSQPVLDAALEAVADLSEVPLAEHHQRLERAHQALHEVLSDSRAER